MKFTVITQVDAVADVESIYQDLIAYDSAYADRWLAELDAAGKDLEVFPNRFPTAPESRHVSRTIRQVIVGRYRVLYTVSEQNVHILRIRHTARRPFKPEELGG